MSDPSLPSRLDINDARPSRASYDIAPDSQEPDHSGDGGYSTSMNRGLTLDDMETGPSSRFGNGNNHNATMGNDPDISTYPTREGGESSSRRANIDLTGHEHPNILSPHNPSSNQNPISSSTRRGSHQTVGNLPRITTTMDTNNVSTAANIRQNESHSADGNTSGPSLIAITRDEYGADGWRVNGESSSTHPPPLPPTSSWVSRGEARRSSLTQSLRQSSSPLNPQTMARHGSVTRSRSSPDRVSPMAIDAFDSTFDLLTEPLDRKSVV